MIASLEEINQKKFIHLLKSKLSNLEENDILIFIHGFNVSFASAIRRTAQITYDLKFKGIPMAYSWPSKGRVSEYMYDEASVQYTTPHLVAFLKEVIKNKGKANIHIIGHSMGTRALANALKEISFFYPGKHVFKNIILAAPDIDRDVFREDLFPYIIKTTNKITLYASSSDKALELSETLHGGRRIGEGGNEVFVYQGLDTIDATGVDTSLLGHSYFAQKEVLVTDLKEVIIKSLPPQKRRSLKEIIREQLAYWKFKLQK
jgi:esterase/lipase superfamily enzyme